MQDGKFIEDIIMSHQYSLGIPKYIVKYVKIEGKP